LVSKFRAPPAYLRGRSFNPLALAHKNKSGDNDVIQGLNKKFETLLCFIRFGL